MILLALLVLAFFISLLLGGRLERLAQLRIRYSYLILLALGIQLLVFSSIWQRWVGDSPWSPILYVFSLLLLIVASGFNWRVPGVIPLASGLLLNALVILANGGRMPASLQALRAAGIVGPEDSFESLRVTNSSLIVEGTPLWFLGDIFAIPKWFPLANVFSVGDVLIGLGGAWFLLVNMGAPRLARLAPGGRTRGVSRGARVAAWLRRGYLFLDLALVLLLILLGLFAFRQYRLAAQREFNAALEAHRVGDTLQAVQRYARVTTLYRLTFSPLVATARANRAECELLQAANEARNQGRLAEALAGYRAYLEQYPKGLLYAHTRGAIAETLDEWATGLREAGKYEAAIAKYQAILEEYADTPLGGRAEMALAEAYAEWAAQLRRSGDYEQAIQTYWVLLADYGDRLAGDALRETVAEVYREWLGRLTGSADLEAYIRILETHLNTPTGAQARTSIAEAYSQWAARLSQAGHYEAAVQRQQIVLFQYADTPAGARARAAIAEAYVQWAMALRETGDYEAAIVRYQLLLQEYADTPAGQGAPAALEETHRQWAAQLGGWALGVMRSRDYDQLIARCQAIVREHPQTPTALNAAQVLSDTYQLAFLARRNKRPCEALSILEAFPKAGQPLESEAEALMPELLCNCGGEKQRKGLGAEAIALFRRVVAEYPESPLTARARAAIAGAEAAQGAGARGASETTPKERP